MNKVLGFSLIELLVAMAIMSMTLLISSLGYSFYMERWQKNLGAFDDSAGNAKKLILIKQAITGIYPYILRDTNGTSAIYFEGNEDGLVAITTRSFYRKETPFVMRLSIEQNVDLTYRLIYEDMNIEIMPITTINRDLEFSSKITLINNLEDIKFSYWGYENSDSRVNNRGANWWNTFNSLNRKIMPEIIMLTFIVNGVEEKIEFPISQIDFRALALFDNV